MQFKLLPLQFVRHPNVLLTYCLSDLEGEILRRGGGISLPSSGGGGLGWCSVELGLMSGGWDPARVPEKAGRGMGHSPRAAG